MSTAAPAPPGSGPGAEPNPYAAPRADIGDGGAGLAGPLTRDEVVLFVGRRSAYYWRAWQRPLRTGGFLAGFNWAACLTSLGWLLYRKMFREAGLAMLALIALGVVQVAIAAFVAVDLETLGNTLTVAWSASLGLLGNGLYLRRTRLAVEDARRREPDPKRRAELLMIRGGTSPTVAVVAAVLALSLLMGVAPLLLRR